MEKPTTIEEIAPCDAADQSPATERREWALVRNPEPDSLFESLESTLPVIIPNRRKMPVNKFRNTAKNSLYEFPDNPTIKLAWAGHQIRRVTLGHADSVACPYCLSTVILGVEKLCCDPMGEATETVLRHIETESQRYYEDNRRASGGSHAGASAIDCCQ